MTQFHYREYTRLLISILRVYKVITIKVIKKNILFVLKEVNKLEIYV